MTTSDKQDAAIEADVRRDRNLSAIWLLPLLALAIGLWMLFEQWREQGPLITITFQSANGLEAGKTRIKTRDVEVGVIESISLSSDLEHVEVEARINQHAERLLRKDTHFWIVAPQIGLGGVSGLNTLVSGVYVELAPGTSKVKRQQFIGLDEPPVTPSNTPGMHITLTSEGMTAYGVGDPVVFQGLSVGKIEEVNFDVSERVVYYKTFINAPYHLLLTDTTRFWNVSGLRVELGIDGINVQTASLQTLLKNSVTFGVPDDMQEGSPATEDSAFAIYPDYATAATPRYRHSVEYVLLLNDSVRGLTAGAPVEYRGIKIGEVLAVNFDREEGSRIMSEDYRIPVLLSLEPGRAGFPDTAEGAKLLREQTDLWIEGGLRAQLKTGNLLTGRLLVDLQHYADEAATEIGFFDEHPVIPTRRGEITQLTNKVEALLDKLYELPLEGAMNDVGRMAREIEATATSAQQLSASLDGLLNDLQREQLVQSLTQTLQAVSELSNSFAAGSGSHGEIIATVEELNARLQELQPVLLHLNQQPNSLIFGGRQKADIEPKAKSQ